MKVKVISKFDLEKIKLIKFCDGNKNFDLICRNNNLFNEQFVSIQQFTKLPELTQTGNGYFDQNKDGAMDKIQITFEGGITPTMLEGATFSFSWLNVNNTVENFIAPIKNFCN